MGKIIHKKGPKTVERYEGFGQYGLSPTPLCAGAKGLYNGNSYLVTHYWKNVTCKHCLNLKDRK